MSHHPFLNPVSSRGYVAAEHQHLLWKKICSAGGVGTLLAVAGTGLLWYGMVKLFGVSFEMVIGNRVVVLTFYRSLLLSISSGVGLSLFLVVLNILVQQPLRVFRYAVLCGYVISCCLLLLLPSAPLQKLAILLILTLNVGTLTTMLTRFVSE